MPARRGMSRGGHSVGDVLRFSGPRADSLHHASARQLRLVTGHSFHPIIGAIMLYYAVVFFVIALIAAFFGFGGIAVGAAGIAKVLFVVFLIGAVVSFLMSMGRRV